MRRQVHAAGVRIASTREAIDIIDEGPQPRPSPPWPPPWRGWGRCWTPSSGTCGTSPPLSTTRSHRARPPTTAAQRTPRRSSARAGARGASPRRTRGPRRLSGRARLSRTALSIGPPDFATPRVAATWTALTALAARGDPIDFVLLAAAVARRDATTTGGVPGRAPAELFRLAERGDPGIGARAVRRSPGPPYRAMAAAQRDSPPPRRTPPWPPSR